MVLLLQNLACKKGIFETLVEGKVINERTGEHIENTIVYITQEPAAFSKNGYKFKDIDPVVTDSRGNYKIKFKT